MTVSLLLAALVLAQILDWRWRGTWLPVHSAVEPVHLATMTCAGIPCEELYDSGVDLLPPYAPSQPWSRPRWWGPVWFRDIPQFADMLEDEFEHEVMRYAIDRMRS